MLFDFFKDFVSKYNIKNGELASQKNLNASSNILKREVNNLYNREEIKRGLTALEWQTDTYYNEGEIASFNGTNYIVIKGQQSINEQPNKSYKWRETLRSEWTLNLDPNGYLNKDNNTKYIPKNPYNPATKQYVDNGDKIVYRDQNPSNGINFLPLDESSLINIEYITGNGLPDSDKNYVAPFTPTAPWHPTNKLYVDTQVQELASGGSITVGKTLNSDALGLRPASTYLTLERAFSGNYNGFAVKDGPAADNIDAIDWLRTTANGLLPYKPYDTNTQDGSELGGPEWKFKAVYGVNGNFDNIISSNANINSLTVGTLNTDNISISNVKTPTITADTGNIKDINATTITADTGNIKDINATTITANNFNGLASDATHLNGIPGTEYLKKSDATSNVFNNGLSIKTSSKWAVAQFWSSDDTHNADIDLFKDPDSGKFSFNIGVFKNNTSDPYRKNLNLGYDGTMVWNNFKVWTQGNDGAGSGLDADLLHGYTLNQDGIPLLRGYGDNGKIVQYSGDLNSISINSTYNIDGTNKNSPEATWGFVTTYIHANFVSGSNAWRSQMFVGMQSDNVYMRRANPNGTWNSWVKMLNTINDLEINAKWLNGLSASQIQIPVGSIIAFPIDKIPSGFLECNGAALSIDTYSELYAVIGTLYGKGPVPLTWSGFFGTYKSSKFNIPDLRGVFIRGFSHGASADSGRIIGSYQSDSLKSHTHTQTGHIGGFFRYSAGGGNNGVGVPSQANVNVSSTGGNETRPENIAMIYCIKY